MQCLGTGRLVAALLAQAVEDGSNGVTQEMRVESRQEQEGYCRGLRRD